MNFLSIFSNRTDFEITGVWKKGKARQLEIFRSELKRRGVHVSKAFKTWWEAFDALEEYVRSLPSGRHLLFFDEMPWLDTQKSDFLAAFESFWNSYGSKNDDLMVVVCGSSSSWLDDKFGDSKGGLFERETLRMTLQPFTLSETECFLESIGIKWSRLDVAECYMALGGIPLYLSSLNPALTLQRNIDALFFAKNAKLRDEYRKLYDTLFKNGASYRAIVETLHKNKSGLTHGEIAKGTGLPPNGVLTEMLQDLERSGFVSVEESKGGKRKGEIYRICDFFTSFYLDFVKGKPGRDESYWSNSYLSPSHGAWAGLSFERLCAAHLGQIKKALGISGVLSETYCWRFRGDSDRAGAQIDLVIDRADHVTTICECKWSSRPYSIGKDEHERLLWRIEAFQKESRTRKTLQLVLISASGLAQGLYSNDANFVVSLDDLFQG